MNSPADVPGRTSLEPPVNPEAGPGGRAFPRPSALRSWIEDLQGWPWAETARMLVRRFREDRLGLTAGSLTFTTLISLVPLFTVGLAVFTAFPMFANFQKALERFLFQNLVPESIARPVMSGVSRFAGQASQLGTLGFVLLILAALALLMTIDRSLNDLWRVRRRRSWTRRVLLYWTLLTLGPLVLGAILALTSWAVSASRGWVGALPGGLSWVVETIQFLLVAGGAAALFHGVPNAPVRWSHAAAGGVFVALGTEVAKAGLGWYLTAVPGLRSIYGAFAVVPIVLLWVYLMWVVVLLGAVVAAYAPALRQPPSARVRGPGRRFEGAISVLSALKEARSQPARGIAEADLTRLLPLDPVDIEAVLQALIDLGWVGRLEDAVSDPPYVLLVDPSAEPAAALMDALLLAPSAVTATFRQAASFETLSLADLLVGQGPQTWEEADGAKPRRSASSTPSGASAIRS